MHAFDLAVYALAAALTVAAYLRDPSLPGGGLRAGARCSSTSSRAWWARSS